VARASGAEPKGLLGALQQPVPRRLDQANGLAQAPSDPHSDSVRAAQTVEQPILANYLSVRPLNPARRLVRRGVGSDEREPLAARVEPVPPQAAPDTVVRDDDPAATLATQLGGDRSRAGARPLDFAAMMSGRLGLDRWSLGMCELLVDPVVGLGRTQAAHLTDLVREELPCFQENAPFAVREFRFRALRGQ
jgi:hypothetical protein